MKGFGLPAILFIQHLIICRGFSVANNATEPDPVIDPTTMKMYDQEVEATQGELNLGMDYFEGDIRLTPQLNDYIKSSRQKSNLDTRALVKDVMKLWTNHEVPYALADGLSDVSRGYIESAMTEWRENTCIQFREKTDADEDYIEFVYEEGCSSYVGRIGGHQTISVGNSDGSITCKHGNIVHEIAHSLGFFHEHSRPDRDSFVTVKWDNIESGYSKCFEKETLVTVDSRHVSYDYGSVMHYGEFFFTKTKGMRTLEPTQHTTETIGQRVGLSAKDIQQGNLLYSCSGMNANKKEAVHSHHEDNSLPKGN